MFSFLFFNILDHIYPKQDKLVVSLNLINRTKDEFWIEAKYRNGLFKNNKFRLVCEICKPWQLDRYKEVEKTSGKINSVVKYTLFL